MYPSQGGTRRQLPAERRSSNSVESPTSDVEQNADGLTSDVNQDGEPIPEPEPAQKEPPLESEPEPAPQEQTATTTVSSL